MARDIEAEVKKAEAKEAAEEPSTPVGTPEPPPQRLSSSKFFVVIELRSS